MQQDVVVAAGASVTVTHTGTVPTPHLWSPSDPYRYNVHANVWVDAAIKDSVNETMGFRFYQLTASDFTFNGSADWDNLQDLGVNYVRLVHYPHAQLEYTLADQRGMLV